MKLHPQNLWWRLVCVALITMAAVAVSMEGRVSGSPETDPLSLSNPARHNDAKPPDGISEQAWGKIVRQIKADRYNISKASSSAGSEETIDPLLTAGEIKLTASDAAAEERFGYSVGDTVVVGAWGNDDAGGDSGSAYIFSRNFGGANNWGQVKKITASDAVAGNKYGLSVAISGDTVVVGAYRNNDAVPRSGSTYLYTLEDRPTFTRLRMGSGSSKKNRVPHPEHLADLWTLTRTCWRSAPLMTAPTGRFISSTETMRAGPIRGNRNEKSTAMRPVSSSDSRLLWVGINWWWGPPYYTNGGKDGAAYVFYRNVGGLDSWGKGQTLTAATDGGGLFGWTVSLSGDKVAVGAPSNWYFAGSAYLFYRNKDGQDTWGEVRRINASDPWALNQFGYTVSLSGDTLAVGAPFHDYDKGAVYIFSRNQGAAPNNADNWGQVQKKMANDAETGDHFGYGLSLNNDQLVVGAPDEDSQGTDSGAVYVFYRNYGGADSWGQAKKKLLTGGVAGNQFGWSVRNNSDAALVGAKGGGAAYLLERNGGASENSRLPTAPPTSACPWPWTETSSPSEPTALLIYSSATSWRQSITLTLPVYATVTHLVILPYRQQLFPPVQEPS